jgi:hypothetical protein
VSGPSALPSSALLRRSGCGIGREGSDAIRRTQVACELSRLWLALRIEPAIWPGVTTTSAAPSAAILTTQVNDCRLPIQEV